MRINIDQSKEILSSKSSRRTPNVPDIVYIYDSYLNKNVLYRVNFFDQTTLNLELKDYLEPEALLGMPFLIANLNDYGFMENSTIQIKVKSPGSYGVSGISPGLAGKTIVFTGLFSENTFLRTMIHELTHAFGLHHKCGNWDYKDNSPENSCCMNYGEWFILDNGVPRKPIQWTNRRMDSSLCAQHLKAVRDAGLEGLSGLGW